MRLLRNHAGLYELIAITFALFIYLNFVVTYGLSVEKEINKNEDLDYMRDFSWDYKENEHGSSAVLSRKRRYLTFPSGSSFQLVYDLIVGVVDYTNYLILGVTSALAWQLPTEAPSEIIEKLQDRLKGGGDSASRNDSIENIQYVDTKSKKTEYSPQNQSYITSYTNPTSSYYTNNQFHPPMNTKYYSSSPVYYSQSGSQQNSVYTRKQDKDYYSTRQNPLTEWKEGKIRKVSPSSFAPFASSNLSSKLSQWWNSKPAAQQTYRKPAYVRKHRIYPVFAKRSIDSHNRPKRHGISGPTLTQFDEIHLRHHRATRQDLYLKIEKYLETHNKNGHECVLKALCETGQKVNEVEPGTFVGEIMRAIFTMPESEDPVYNYKHKIYDDAHAYGGSCEDKYPLCADSVWKADFIF